VGVAVPARTGVVVRLGVPTNAAVIVGVSLWLAGPGIGRVAEGVWLGSLPAVETIAGLGVGVFVNLGPGVVVGPAVNGVNWLFSAREVLTTEYGSDREPASAPSRPNSPHSRQAKMTRGISAIQAIDTGFRSGKEFVPFPVWKRSAAVEWMDSLC
jgi:hypothetical protein